VEDTKNRYSDASTLDHVLWSLYRPVTDLPWMIRDLFVKDLQPASINIHFYSDIADTHKLAIEVRNRHIVHIAPLSMCTKLHTLNPTDGVVTLTVIVTELQQFQNNPAIWTNSTDKLLNTDKLLEGGWKDIYFVMKGNSIFIFYFNYGIALLRLYCPRCQTSLVISRFTRMPAQLGP
jgi:hypothetical protein